MHRWWILAALLAAGCEEIDSTGNIFEPRPGTTGPQVTDLLEGPQGSFDFEAEDRTPADETDATANADGEDAGFDDLAEGLGIDADLEGTPPRIDSAPAQPTAPHAVVLPVQPPTPAQPTPWTPGEALPGSWGVRLVSTIADAHPPRAILGMPDGREEVVQAGTLLPEAGVVVLAVGRDAVQVAEIVPEGDRARVNQQVLTALYPSAPEQH